MAEGFANIEEIAEVEISEFAHIEGFDEEIGEELKNRAYAYINDQNQIFKKNCQEMGMEDQILELDGLKATSF